MQKRRQFLKSTAALVSALSLSPSLQAKYDSKSGLKIASQQYPWFTFFQRDGKSWEADLNYSFQQLGLSGFEAFEPTLTSVQEVAELGPILQKNKIQSHSLYVNSVLHDPVKEEESMKEVLSISEAAKALGAKIIVTNPSPIRWGGEEDKSDEELKTQAKALNQLGEKLRQQGLVLAYHNHDAEMRNSAREFHHMMMVTDPQNVKLCLDAHWIFRGAGNSQVALFDIVQMYMDRIVELHLRQSKDGIWTEEFCEGDIDYERLAKELGRKNIMPHLVLEQAVEKESPNTMTAVKAHRLGLTYAKTVFADFLD